MLTSLQKRQKMYHLAAYVLQRAYRFYRMLLLEKYGPGIFVRRGKQRYYDDRADAAAIIQRAWRKYLVCCFKSDIFL